MVIQAQLCDHQSMDFSQSLNGFGFNNLRFVDQQQKPQQQELMQYDQRMHSFLVDNRVPVLHQINVCDQQSVDFSQIISVLGEKQRMEIDRFICLQNQRLRLALQEQRKQQISLLLKKYESKTQILLKQKEEEISKASKRTLELEDFIKRMEIENQTWQRVAKQNEAIVASLNSTIERLREAASLSSNAADDAASCCHNEEEKTENGEKNMICKCCNTRNSCMIMIPCRHLSSCKDCEAFLDFCPVCSTFKKASIEALM